MKSGSIPPGETPAGAASRIITGTLQLARGDAQGIEAFRNTPEALLSALAPSVALFVVMGLSQLTQRFDAMQVTKVLILIAALLTRLVISQLAAAFWGRESLWTRYATALLWCGWLPVVVSLFALTIVQLILPGIGSLPAALGVIMLGVELYELWLGWFIARKGLQISGGKAAGLVVLMNVSVAALYLIAALFPPHYNALHELVAPLPKS
ncbi:hypothetical protein [Asaia spathodeae]|uniref:Yip1 domain-containing protein n=1 Tax=Asaia spathodeae TaxID=657016 RepID=A0ABX2P0Z5_9PROT|nr:hypothetical protein [Asaia spathodeae]GBR14019.1 hypothetical protein AA105894_0965 [Asaia spathodeae NBRC 105894]